MKLIKLNYNIELLNKTALFLSNQNIVYRKKLEQDFK